MKPMKDKIKEVGIKDNISWYTNDYWEVPKNYNRKH